MSAGRGDVEVVNDSGDDEDADVSQSPEDNEGLNMSSNSKTSLNKLLSDVKRLSCNICSFITDSDMSLLVHKRSHCPFECEHCGYRHALASKIHSHSLRLVRIDNY